jgi:hypothetical protein
MHADVLEVTVLRGALHVIRILKRGLGEYAGMGCTSNGGRPEKEGGGGGMRCSNGGCTGNRVCAGRGQGVGHCIGV